MRLNRVACIGLVVAGCSSANGSTEDARDSTPAATTNVVTVVTEPPERTDAPTTTEPSTTATTATTTVTTLAPECKQGDRERRNLQADGAFDRWACEEGRWVFVEAVAAPSTTSSTEPGALDQNTVEFYKSGLGSLMCDYDFDVAQAVASVELDESSYDRICAGEPAVVTSTREGTPVEPTEFAAVLLAPSAAWLNQPSGPGFDALAAAAAQLLDSNRPFAAPLPLTETDVIVTLSALRSYPGQDYLVAFHLADLAPMIPGLPAIIGNGVFTVGVDIEPGRYRTIEAVDGCYWETLDEAGEINDNNFVNAAPQVIMTVRSSDFAVNSEDCGPWVKVG